LRLLRWDRHGLELRAAAEHGDVAVASVSLLPPGLQVLGALLLDVLV